MTYPTQKSPYMPLQRNFPYDNLQALAIEIDAFHILAALNINAREIGTYAVNSQTVTGQQWYLNGEVNKQQTLRQIYSITSGSSFNHNINFATVTSFTTITGIGYDGTNYFPLPYVSPFSAADCIGLFVTSTQVMIVVGAGAPTITSGIITLEWISQI